METRSAQIPLSVQGAWRKTWGTRGIPKVAFPRPVISSLLVMKSVWLLHPSSALSDTLYSFTEKKKEKKEDVMRGIKAKILIYVAVSSLQS